MISFHCADCGKLINVKDQLAGRRGKCPNCGAITIVPSSSASQQPAETMEAQPVAEGEHTQPFHRTRRALAIGVIVLAVVAGATWSIHSHFLSRSTQQEANNGADEFRALEQTLISRIESVKESQAKLATNQSTSSESSDSPQVVKREESLAQIADIPTFLARQRSELEATLEFVRNRPSVKFGFLDPTDHRHTASLVETWLESYHERRNEALSNVESNAFARDNVSKEFDREWNEIFINAMKSMQGERVLWDFRVVMVSAMGQKGYEDQYGYHGLSSVWLQSYKLGQGRVLVVRHDDCSRPIPDCQYVRLWYDPWGEHKQPELDKELARTLFEGDIVLVTAKIVDALFIGRRDVGSTFDPVDEFDPMLMIELDNLVVVDVRKRH